MDGNTYFKSDIRIRREQRHQRRHRKTVLNFINIFCVMAVIAALSGIIIVKAEDRRLSETPQYKYYTSISIEKNDTLWDIAVKYAPADTDVNTYIREIKRMNRLTSDKITQGQKLVVSYYSDEVK